ncbi:MAG: hypothetical protein OMM_00512 [Candidatus Magnetoglobus multicellularis str. Araruama]|uniref:Uncharacterized protein n=2 Tax=Candidatus Magnetoglobus multicellularis TaxID=418099 RepID=F4ZYT3_9BACT|nr:hypothetical protein OMM_4 [Candidatus Magnetoglobus multicellularis]ETR64728.1 MAG: hypothetical protein OMM_00512 [Candidatus Magnetoglobus multicellularis str. Araruama]
MDDNHNLLDKQTAQILTKDLILLEKKCKALQEMNESLKKKHEHLKADDLQLDQSIEFVSGSIQDNAHKKAAALDELQNLREQNDQMVNEINKIQAMKKATHADLDNTSLLIESLGEELDALKTEKSMALDRIAKMKKAIKDINLDKERKLPRLKKYDAMLKRAHGLFQETKSRMDISMKLRKVLQSTEETALN